MNEISKPGQALAAPAVSKASFKPLKECNSLEEAFQTRDFMDRIQASVPQHVQPNRMLRTFVTAVSRTPLLAACSVRSFVGACLTLSQVGLEPNTPLGHAYLIPFKNKKWNPATRARDIETVEINVIFGYPGLLDLSFRSKLVKSVHADVVWPGDDFSFEYGSDAHLRHKPKGMPIDDGQRPVYAYMHAVLVDGQAFRVLPYSDVLAIRNKSQAFRYALAAKEEAEAKNRRAPLAWTEAPWVAHEIPMARKTAFRAASNWLPRSVELASAIALDEGQDRRRSMDFGSVIDAPTIDGNADYLGAAADAANADENEEDPGAGVRTGGVQVKLPGADPGQAQAQAEAQRQAQEEERRKALAREQEAQRKAATAKMTAPSFEAVLIDANGDPTPGTFNDAVSFARAFMILWSMSNEAEDGGAIQALEEHNEDALLDAGQDAAASAILQRRYAEQPEEPPPPSGSDFPGDDNYAPGGTVKPTVRPAIVAVEPPSERGKVSWPGYVKSLKAALLANVEQSEFGVWCAAQRTNLERCPTAQRVLAIRAITETAGMLRADPPSWLADLIKPKESKPAPESKAQADPPTEAVTDADEKWVNASIVEMNSITTRAAFDALVGSGAVRTIMARLRREKRPLFDRADAAFSAKHQTLPPAEAAV